MRKATAALLLGVALAGCSGSKKGDEVRPDLPRVTIEVSGMT